MISKFSLVAAWLTFLLLACSGLSVNGQLRSMTLRDQQRKAIRDYSMNWAQWYRQQQYVVDSLARKNNYRSSFSGGDGVALLLRRFEHQHPVWIHTHNLDAAITAGVDVLWDEPENELSGKGIITGLWDGGGVLTEHNEFFQTGESRIIQRDQPNACNDHSTHLAGTMVAGGVDKSCHGMAPLGTVVAYDFNFDVSEMGSEAADGLLASNHSYGTICGWKYNPGDEAWYWYGDLDISTDEDLNFGRYSKESYDLDLLTYLAPWYLIVKSAGNDRNDAPPENTPHFDFSDHWYEANDYHPPDGSSDGYECMGSMSVAKNIITVGAVAEVLSGYSGPEDVEMSIFSSWGPTDDGRIKPDLVANGTSIYSSIAQNVNQYETYDGTSMAAASVSGVVTLINQMQKECQPGVPLAASSVKGLLIHSAREAGAYPGPDYRFGWGLINASAAVELLKTNRSSGGQSVMEDELADETVFYHEIYIPGDCPELKVTLCWTDPAGQIAEYVLDDETPVLVNNLDIELVRLNDGTVFYPWVLDPDEPSAPAIKGINNLDNVEQVVLSNPMEGEYLIRISSRAGLKYGKQSFSLIISGQDLSSGLYPPSNLERISDDSEVFLTWYAPDEGEPSGYNIYRNGSCFATCHDTAWLDSSVQNDIEYSYYVTAEYGSFANQSLPTNEVVAKPHEQELLPYVVTFEEEPVDWSIKDDTTGWLWGNSSTLSSYYLDFGNNTGSFLGADSYSAGEGVHVWDGARSPPLALDLYERVTLSFNYLLVTGIYDAIDELVIMACKEGDSCIEIVKLSKSSSWESMNIDITEEMRRSNTRLVFYYDDNYRWGMGAGIDDITVTGIPLVPLDNRVDVEDSPVVKVGYEGGRHVVWIGGVNVSENMQLQVVAIDGKVLWEENWGNNRNAETRVVLPSLPTGLYILRYSSSAEVSSVKFEVR
ncbi:S8 family peptidase [Marinilabilia rubra]|uniref:Peptidase S8/S53 domain-containing protein n=1 Tax=Marinilabilia rubra TaxID=2162893 RepID=A0A2U2BCZ4_9BACT|nr:S8 family peptidase [Marinilabilia rubra]PWE00931.1 hypothetical protein DDZ16_00100 [Marinilabilia rubra]